MTKVINMTAKLILASGSPRRKELLQQLHLPFSIQVSDLEETFNEQDSPENIVMLLALQKAQEVAKNHFSSYVLGADTVVVSEGRILGKPVDEQDAISTLQSLSGKTHQVMTGVAIIFGTNIVNFYERTDVTFWELTQSEIERYVKSGEPMDKAGSYGIQGLGAAFVKEIHGDYFSVVGLPLARTIRELRSIGFSF